MDWSEILKIVLEAVGSIGAAVITGLASWLFTKLASKIKDSRINTFVKEAVKAAEQLYPNLGTKTGAEKLQYVTDLVKNKWPKLDNDYVNAIIEGAVFTLNNQLDSITSSTTTSTTTEKQTEVKNTNSIESSGIQVD